MIAISDQSLLSAAMDYLEQPVFFVREGLVSYCNRAASQRSIAVNQPVKALLGPTAKLYAPSGGELLLSVSAGGHNYDAVVHHHDGLDVFTLNSKPTEMLDISVLATIAKTIRFPLSNLFAAATNLFPYLEELEDPRIQDETSLMNKSFFQLLRTVGNLSDAGLLMSGQASLNLEQMDLQAFVEIICHDLQPVFRKAGLTLQPSMPKKFFTIWIDRDRVERAILNLISNAMKYTPRGGTIQLHMERLRDDVVIRVIDDGEGMDPSTLSSAFSRFLHFADMTDPRSGIGLGLPLVRQIAQLHGGTVMLENRPGGGFSATMSLSMKRPEGQASAVRSPVMPLRRAADYAGGYSHTLLELSDVASTPLFNSINIF